MIRKRSTRTLATMCLTASFVVTAMAGPALVSAAPAPLAFGFGPGFNTEMTSGSMSDGVAPGYKAAFEIWARNDGSSNIAKLFLTGITPGTFFHVDVTNTGTTGSCVQGSGANDVELQCSWPDGVNPGATIQIRVVFTPPTSGTAMPVDFEWSTTGYVVPKPGKKNNSHGDAFSQHDSVALIDDINNFNGGYLVDGQSLIVATSAALNRNNNPQSTKITAPEDGIPVTAGEDDDISACTSNFDGCFGQAIVLNVNNGFFYVGGFRVDVVYNVNKPNAKMVHFKDNGDIQELEACGVTPVAPCASVTTENGKTFVTLYLNDNGKTFGH